MPSYEATRQVQAPWENRHELAKFNIQDLGKAKAQLTETEITTAVEGINADIRNRMADDCISVFTDGTVQDDGTTAYGIYYDNGSNI